MYVVVNNEEETAQIYLDQTQAAEKMGVSSRTIWYNKGKGPYKRGNLTLYYCPEGVIGSNRGNNKGYIISNGMNHDNF